MQTDLPIRAALLRPIVVLVAIMLTGSLAIGTTAFAQETTARQLPRVYVFTQVAKPGQPVPPDQAGRQDSVKDLREELRKKKGLLEVVDAPEPTDVRIEVTRRERLSPAQCLVTVRLRMVARNYGREFQAEGATWKDAASLLTEVIRRWVNETYDTPTQAVCSGCWPTCVVIATTLVVARISRDGRV